MANSQQLPSIIKLLAGYNKEGKPHLRLGQYFINKYVKYSWPELYYEKDDEKAIKAITIYLQHYQYTDTLPTPTEAWLNVVSIRK